MAIIIFTKMTNWPWIQDFAARTEAIYVRYIAHRHILRKREHLVELKLKKDKAFAQKAVPRSCSAIDKESCLRTLLLE